MIKFYPKLIFSLLMILCSYFSFAQVSVTATAATTGPTAYTTLKAAFDAINAGTHKGVITVNITGNTTETGSATINPNSAPASYTAINVGTSGAFTVTLNAVAPVINLNGATNVTINGNNTLQLINNNSSGNVLSFVNDASGNFVKNLTMKGATNTVDATSGAINSGIIKFGTGVTTGNDNNSIDNCDVDGTSTSTSCLFSSGAFTSVAIENSGDTVKNSRFHDNINGSLTSSITVFLSDGNTGWVIQNNSIYHTLALSTTQQIIVRPLLILPDFTSDAHTVTGNFIGGNATGGNGTMSLTATGAGVIGFIGIDVETGGAGNVVQNNTVRNVTGTYANAAGSFSNSGIFAFIGGFNGGTSITGNTVSNLTLSNTAGFIVFNGIHVNGRVTASGTVTPSFTISTNNINNLTCNSGGGTAGDIQMHGIRLETSSAGALSAAAISNPTFTVSGNTITNLSAPYNGSSTFIRGIGTILTQGTTGGTSTSLLNPKVDINNNTINTFTTTSTLAAYNAGVLTGIHFGGASSTATSDVQKITGNTISNLSETNTVDSGSVVIGILASIGIHDVSKNKIFDLKSAAPGTLKNAGLVGITVRNVVGASTVTNNFVSIGNGQTSNLFIAGILHNFVGATGSVSAYFNTVVISGAGAAGNNRSTFGLLRGTETLANTVTSSVTVKDNIFYNTRTGGGTHYGIGNTYTSSPTGWVSDYNEIYSVTPTTIALWGAANNDLATYKTNSADVNSKSVIANFVNVITGDLHLTGTSVTDVNLKGIPIAGIVTDIDGDTRNASTPFIGADEAACIAPAITTQPIAQSICTGSPLTLTVVATGTSVTYQWRKGGVNIAGATSATYTVASAAATDAGSYDVVITNSCGTVTTTPVTVTVTTGATITTQPTAQAVCSGVNANFSVVATGTGLTYQWQFNGTNIAGATGTTYTVTGATAANAGNYSVVVSSGTCSVTSNSVALTINAATAITTQPASVSVCTGAATFTVVATGTAPLTYQWRKAGVNIAGATNASFTIPAVTATDAGSYDVVVSGACGSVTSNPATLTFTFCTAVPSVDENISSAVLMPTVINQNAVLRVIAKRATTIKWEISDVNGRLIMMISNHVTTGQNDLQLKLGQLAKGTYQLRGITEKGTISVIRMIKL